MRRWLHVNPNTRFRDRVREDAKGAGGFVICVGWLVIFVVRGEFVAALAPIAAAVVIGVLFLVFTNDAGPKQPSELIERLRKAHRH